MLTRQYASEEPLTALPLEQKQQLEKRWQRYLVQHWGSATHLTELQAAEEGGI